MMKRKKIKVLSCIFHQRLGPVNVLPAKGCSQAVPFRHLSNCVFRSNNISQTLKLRGSYFLKKCSKIYLDLAMAMKCQKKTFGFLDNCLWIALAKFSSSWREYLSSAVNVLRNSFKTLDLSKRDMLLLNSSLIN